MAAAHRPNYATTALPDSETRSGQLGYPPSQISSTASIGSQATSASCSYSAIDLTDYKQSHGQHITYSWRNISVSAPRPTSMCPALCDMHDSTTDLGPVGGKQLLKNVNGAVSSGQLTCILGASGAGKTTFLNTITFQGSSKLKTTGDMFINGQVVDESLLKTVSAYVQQMDLFIGTLTVREHLVFNALLRMPKEVSIKRRMDRVEEVIEEFGLHKCADTTIGITGRIKGISGGEQKRLSFASSILTDPKLMFCDEPTSGLDSFMAETIVSTLKTQALKGMGILCTIHQPSSAIFALFDQVIVMAEGRVAFFGSSEVLLDFFRDEGYPCPANYNPAEFLGKTLAVQTDNEEKSREAITVICNDFDRSSLSADLRKIIEENSYPRTEPATKAPTPGARALGRPQSSNMTTDDSTNDAIFDSAGFDRSKNHYKASWLAQFRAVLWRSWMSIIKDPSILKMRLAQNVALALIIGCVFYGQKMDQDGVQNINGSIFIIITAITYQNVFGVMNVFCAELPVFLREHAVGMYRVDVYFLSKVIADLPFYILYPTIMLSICYYMIGLNSDLESVLYIGLTLILITNATTAFGYLLSCLAPNIAMALVLAPALLFPFVIFSGFFMNSGSGPAYLKWIKHISWYFYGYEAIAIAQWKDVTEIACTRSAETCPPDGLTGIMVLKTLGFDYDEDALMFDLGALGALVLMFQFFAFVALLVRTIRKN